MRPCEFARPVAILALACGILSSRAGLAQDIKAHQLIGCWFIQGPEPKTKRTLRSETTYCFRGGGELYYRSFGGDDGWDGSTDWWLENGRELSIGDSRCSALHREDKGVEMLILGHCGSGGVWTKLCAKLSPEGDGCAADEK